MTPEEREKIDQLARLIHDEQDPAKFSALAEQLCELLDSRRKRIGIPMLPFKPPQEDWRALARQASTEEDPYKLLDLIQQVIEKYDEAKRRRRRIA